MADLALLLKVMLITTFRVRKEFYSLNQTGMNSGGFCLPLVQGRAHLKTIAVIKQILSNCFMQSMDTVFPLFYLLHVFWGGVLVSLGVYVGLKWWFEDYLQTPGNGFNGS